MCTGTFQQKETPLTSHDKEHDVNGDL